ncbi:MAG: GntR family transcriptional regulator [Steroidobacteraceae bacterium]
MNDQQWTRALRRELDRQDPSAPRYQRLERALQTLIGAAGSRPAVLPGERTLAKMTGFSRVTVRRALADLGSLGLVRPKAGSGTYVGERIERSLSRLTGFTEDLRARGLNPRVLFLERARGQATADEAMGLSVAPGTPVIRLRRLRYGNDRVLALELTVVPQEFLAEAELVEESLYETLERLGHRPTRALQRIRAVSIDGEVATLMEVEDGMAGLDIERRAFIADGRAVEYTRSTYRGDAYDFVAELEAEPG